MASAILSDVADVLAPLRKDDLIVAKKRRQLPRNVRIASFATDRSGAKIDLCPLFPMSRYWKVYPNLIFGPPFYESAP